MLVLIVPIGEPFLVTEYTDVVDPVAGDAVLCSGAAVRPVAASRASAEIIP
jgi:hypothetical protein